MQRTNTVYIHKRLDIHAVFSVLHVLLYYGYRKKKCAELNKLISSLSEKMLTFLLLQEVWCIMYAYI